LNCGLSVTDVIAQKEAKCCKDGVAKRSGDVLGTGMDLGIGFDFWDGVVLQTGFVFWDGFVRRIECVLWAVSDPRTGFDLWNGFHSWTEFVRSAGLIGTSCRVRVYDFVPLARLRSNCQASCLLATRVVERDRVKEQGRRELTFAGC